MKVLKVNRALLFSAVFCPLMSMGQEIINLGNRREIFVDDYLIGKLDGLSIKMHKPRDEGAVLYFDKPWEGVFGIDATIIKDKDVYRAYYRGLGAAGDESTDNEYTCYAQSKDGIHWEKPDLGLYEVHGTFNNNVVHAGAAPLNACFSPFLDTNPEVAPDRRYKTISGAKTRNGYAGVFAYVSPDGIHWRKLQEESIFQQGALDSQNVSFWSESEQCYVAYVRTKPVPSGTTDWIRSIGRLTSTDFIHWTDLVEMTFGDTPMEHLYTNQTSPYFRAPHIYIAIGGRFMPGRQVVSDEQAKELNVDPVYFKNAKDCSDAFIMSSRGGNVYDRTFMEAFIRPDIGMENWVSRSNYPALNVVQTGPAEMSVYVCQNYAQPADHLHRYSMRLDGFSSLNAPYKGGELITKYFTFSGSELEINYSTSAPGGLKFEIQDEAGVPIQGYTMEDADEIIGNEIARSVSWKGKKDVKPLASRTVRLRVWMKDADLFSIKFN